LISSALPPAKVPLTYLPSCIVTITGCDASDRVPKAAKTAVRKSVLVRLIKSVFR
jgi:hypothetical protein